MLCQVVAQQYVSFFLLVLFSLGVPYVLGWRVCNNAYLWHDDYVENWSDTWARAKTSYMKCLIVLFAIFGVCYIWSLALISDLLAMSMMFLLVTFVYFIAIPWINYFGAVFAFSAKASYFTVIMGTLPDRVSTYIHVEVVRSPNYCCN